VQNYVSITRDFHAIPALDRLKDDGKNVTVGMVQEEENKKTPKGKTDARLSIYDGILEIHDAEDVMTWLNTIKNKDDFFLFFDYGDLFSYSQRALDMGFTKGIFPTEEGYKLESDRQYGKEFAKKHYPQLKVADVKEFKKIEDAIKFLDEQEDKVFVLKSEGSNAETVVPQTDDADLGKRQIIGALQSEKADYEKGGFTLEELIRNPIEISPVMVFWNGKPLYSIVELENKPLGAGNIGRLTGGCQNLTIQTPMGCALNKIAFPPIVQEMAAKVPGIGIFDAGLLFDGKQFCFTEWCSQRWGFDGFYCETAMCGDATGKGCAANHFDLIAEGKSPLKWKYGAAVRLFQTEPCDKNPGCYAGGYAVDWLDGVSDRLFVYLLQKKQVDGVEDAIFVSNGYEKDVGTATGCGNTPEEAINRAYECAEGIAMTGLYYRPEFDFLSRDYFTSIPNRLEFLNASGLIA
jgi:hypothetical protein